jgi:hypothetical protein
VSFSSEYLSPLGPPVVALPRLLLQPVVLKPDAPEGFIDVTVTTGNEDAEGYEAEYIIRPRMNAVSEGKRLQTN